MRIGCPENTFVYQLMSKMLKYCFGILFILNGMLNQAFAETNYQVAQDSQELSYQLSKKDISTTFLYQATNKEEGRLFLEEKYEEEDDKAKSFSVSQSFFIRCNLKQHWLASIDNEDVLANLSTSLYRESLYNRSIYLLIEVFRI